MSDGNEYQTANPVFQYKGTQISKIPSVQPKIHGRIIKEIKVTVPHKHEHPLPVQIPLHYVKSSKVFNPLKSASFGPLKSHSSQRLVSRSLEKFQSFYKQDHPKKSYSKKEDFFKTEKKSKKTEKFAKKLKNSKKTEKKAKAADLTKRQHSFSLVIKKKQKKQPKKTEKKVQATCLEKPLQRMCKGLKTLIKKQVFSRLKIKEDQLSTFRSEDIEVQNIMQGNISVKSKTFNNELSKSYEELLKNQIKLKLYQQNQLKDLKSKDLEEILNLPDFNSEITEKFKDMLSSHYSKLDSYLNTNLETIKQALGIDSSDSRNLENDISTPSNHGFQSRKNPSVQANDSSSSESFDSEYSNYHEFENKDSEEIQRKISRKESCSEEANQDFEFVKRTEDKKSGCEQDSVNSLENNEHSQVRKSSEDSIEDKGIMLVIQRVLFCLEVEVFEIILLIATEEFGLKASSKKCLRKGKRKNLE